MGALVLALSAIDPPARPLKLRSLSTRVGGCGEATTGAEADLGAVEIELGPGRCRTVALLPFAFSFWPPLVGIELTDDDPSLTLPESSRTRSGVDPRSLGILSCIARIAFRTKSALDMCFCKSAMCRSVFSMSIAAVTVWTTPGVPNTVVGLQS